MTIRKVFQAGQRFLLPKKSYIQKCYKCFSMDINSTVALVTGSTSGIGLSIASELLEQNAKAVIISGIRDQQGEEAVRKLNDKYGQKRCEYLHLDTTNKKEFEDAFKLIFKKYGSLDILVNNAGILHDKEWEKTISVNINGVVYGVILAKKYMSNKPSGAAVVNVASILGIDVIPYTPIYNLSKFAIVGLTRSFQNEEYFKNSGIKVVALCPGVTDTELVSSKVPMLYEEWTPKAFDELASFVKQSSTVIGKAAAYVIKHGETGTCWPVEGHVLYKADFPTRKDISIKISDLK
ncbi:15-hydroxyprostaglandin dehydrogenase [NAD(+)]-like isoform X1 [Cimex lectularius]|uniref:Alcohol dehydrogenase n=2 Tax=Cimex lectularius TaxID=79782 RepID=A0A8I6RVU9_CIMLE|nr:15-hydroxyprostaglandin dehydrogenase [NAD(+)]-like isoform X1 [Cimex lectularius]